MASRGSEAQRLCKRDRPINAYVWRDIYSVGDRKQDSVRERRLSYGCGCERDEERVHVTHIQTNIREK